MKVGQLLFIIYLYFFRKSYYCVYPLVSEQLYLGVVVTNHFFSGEKAALVKCKRSALLGQIIGQGE
jgi:hypothetical protein